MEKYYSANGDIACFIKHPFDKYERLACNERKDAEKVAEQMMNEGSTTNAATPTFTTNVFTAPAGGTYFPTTHKLTQAQIDAFKIYNDQELTDLIAAVNGSIASNTAFLGLDVSQLNGLLPILQAEYNRRDLSKAGYNVKQKLAAATLAKLEADAKYSASLQQVDAVKQSTNMRGVLIWGSVIIVAATAAFFVIKKLAKKNG